ncbi:MAG: hypothetical protein U0798_00395 [Gemmataceae bacterium]
MLGRGALLRTMALLTLVVGVFPLARVCSQEPLPPTLPTQFPPAAPKPVNAADLVTIPIDKNRAIFSHIDDRSPIRSESQSPDEYAAYNAVLIHARHIPVADLESHARRDVMYKDLFHSVRKEFKLDLVRFEGRLKRLRSIGPTRQLKEAGIETLYEGWIVPREQPKFLLCFLTTELPEGLEAQQELGKPALNMPVSISGYFFKLMAYETPEAAKDPKKTPIEYAPLLMGRSIVVLKETGRDPADDWFGTFLPALVAVMGTIAAIVIGLTLWYRRGDRTVQSTIAARYETNPFA